MTSTATPVVRAHARHVRPRRRQVGYDPVWGVPRGQWARFGRMIENRYRNRYRAPRPNS